MAATSIINAGQMLAQNADDTRMRPVAEYTIGEEEERALAQSAGPPSVGEKATLYVFSESGYRKVREGTNGFACLVQRSWSSPLMRRTGPGFWDPRQRAPICYSPLAATTIMPEYLRRTELALAGKTAGEIRAAIIDDIGTGRLRGPVVPAIAYMLSAGTAIGANPTPGGAAPHLMVYLPYADQSTVGEPSAGSGIPSGFDLLGTSLATFVAEAKERVPVRHH